MYNNKISFYGKMLLFFNWKLNHPIEEFGHIFKAYTDYQRSNPTAQIVIFPAFPFLHDFGMYGFEHGAQNVSSHKDGAHTGEVSAKMLSHVGCKYCLVGHSERRHQHGESIAQITKKVEVCLEYSITPVLCIGETQEEASSGRQQQVLTAQLESFAPGAIIAYEPVWAIGTNNTPTPSQISQATSIISQHAPKSPIIYGGSVKAQTVPEVLSAKGLSGLLVGGASLKGTSVEALLKALT